MGDPCNRYRKTDIIDTKSQLNNEVIQRSIFQVLTWVCDVVLRLYETVKSIVNKKSVGENCSIYSHL